ncbi:MAG: biopolymer transporter ExbD [Pseudomonadales bacterium]|nr:biopolymer transporter ExbD [Pseudomonadales bacterium]
MKSRQRRNDAIGIELAPLIDIVFILLIFFVVSSTFIRENVLEIELPTSQSTADARADETIEVVITANNEIQVGERLIPKSSR